MTRWKLEPLYVSSLPDLPMPFSPVQRARKFSTVFGHGLAVEAHHNATGGLAVNLNVEEDLVGHLRAGGHELERREKRDGDDL